MNRHGPRRRWRRHGPKAPKGFGCCGDVFTVQDILRAVEFLEAHNVPPTQDGYYIAHTPQYTVKIRP
jgi:hypothetical protein